MPTAVVVAARVVDVAAEAAMTMVGMAVAAAELSILFFSLISFFEFQGKFEKKCSQCYKAFHFKYLSKIVRNY